MKKSKVCILHNESAMNTCQQHDIKYFQNRQISFTVYTLVMMVLLFLAALPLKNHQKMTWGNPWQIFVVSSATLWI